MGDGQTSSAMSKNVYDVFLSFRGPDTRQGFTDCLYHALIDAGITVFRDDDELRPGDKLIEILTATDNSKLCVVVFSRTFAASAWCLREVERMIGMKKEIVPIFYDVTPDDVKLKTPLYYDALTYHETKYGKEQVQQWIKALIEIPRIKGWELKNSGFGEFSRQLVKEILTKLKVKTKYEIQELVLVPDEVEDALKLLYIASLNERRILGIHGMGGIGKTTLAKVVFNQISDSFDCSCFLENAGNSLSQGLHEKLLKSLNPSLRDAIDPMEIIKMNFTSKKVIIVLDDIDEKNQIHSLVGDSGWFGLGSRIIFTTRKARLHEQLSSSNATFHGLEKKEMNPKQALELFSKHAFGQDAPPKHFKDLSNEVVSVTGGLPLALEVVGSFLCRQNAKVWKSTTKKLKEAPVQDVQRKLRLSYDALEPEQQKIFLDIACFFIDKDKRNAVYMWEACDFYPDHGIEVLISMSLIKITHEKCFWMHDQLRDLGRAIVNEKSGDPRACSRLWVAKDALDQLRGHSGKERVEAIQLNGDDSITLDREDFVSLKKLRFLDLRRITSLSGDFADILPKLRWLSLSNMSGYGFTATNLCHKELAVLEFYLCNLEVNWHGWSQFLISENLKVLTISGCSELTSMPDLSKLVNLERLKFSCCNNLISIHSSVGKLRHLKHLALEFGYSSIPRPHHNLPESIGDLVCLTTLTLCYMRLTKLPKDIGELVQLKHLSLYGCQALKVIPECIGDLRSLVSLDLMKTGITQLPTAIAQLTKLESLKLSCCLSLHSFPKSKWIDQVHELPTGLTVLKIGNIRKIKVSNLVNLSHLEISNLESYHLPDGPDVVIEGIEKLSKLKHLELLCRYVKCLSMELSAAHHLKSLRLYCPNLEVRKFQLPSSSLKSLDVEVKDWGEELLLNLASLKNLSELSLTHSGYAMSVSMDLSALQKLKSLKLRCLNSNLEFKQCQLPSSLESLELKVEQWGQLLPINVSSLKNLSELKLTNFTLEGIDKIQGLECLKDLRIYDCVLKFNCFPVLVSLRNLELSSCVFPSECLDMSQLDRLHQLRISGANGQVEISGIGKLQHLSINEYKSFQTMEYFKGVFGKI